MYAESLQACRTGERIRYIVRAKARFAKSRSGAHEVVWVAEDQHMKDQEFEITKPKPHKSQCCRL